MKRTYHEYDPPIGRMRPKLKDWGTLGDPDEIYTDTTLAKQLADELTQDLVFIHNCKVLIYVMAAELEFYKGCLREHLGYTDNRDNFLLDAKRDWESSRKLPPESS